MLSAAAKLCKLRGLMKAKNIDALLVTSSDCHSSEYTPKHARQREYLTGFTGSAGTALITEHQALLWTDGR